MSSKNGVNVTINQQDLPKNIKQQHVFGEDKGNSDTVKPRSDINREIANAKSDHECARNAFIYEVLQNYIDQLRHALVASSNIPTPTNGFELTIKIDLQHNTIEIYDNAGGMTPEKVVTSYLSISNPGEEKQGKSTGGSEGHGFWSMATWSDKTYIETVDKNLRRWGVTVRPASLNPSYQQAKYKFKDHIDVPQAELSHPGLYVRFEGIDTDTLQSLSNWERVESDILSKFAFGLQSDKVGVRYIVADGEGETEHTPTVPDVEKVKGSDALLVEDEDLPPFEMESVERQLTGLHVVDSRKVDFEPPWKGIAMLKGNDYGDPYLNVWGYTGKASSVLNSGQIWGWVDASSLCPDLEYRAHHQFVDASKIYRESSLSDRMGVLEEEEFGRKTVEEQEEANKQVIKTLHRHLSQYHDINEDSESGIELDEGEDKTVPTVTCCTPPVKQPGEEVPLKVNVEASHQCEITDIHLNVELLQTRTADGEDPSEDQIKTNDEYGYEVMVDSEPEVLKPGGDPIEKDGLKQLSEGCWTLRATIKETPTPPPGVSELTFDKEAALQEADVIDSSFSTVNVGEVPVTDSGGVPRNDVPPLPGGIQSIQTASKPRKWLTEVDTSTKKLSLNRAHPAWQYWKTMHHGTKDTTVDVHAAVMGGFMRFLMESTQEELITTLEDAGAANSEVVNAVKATHAEVGDIFQEFMHDFLLESPLTSTKDIVTAEERVNKDNDVDTGTTN